MKFFCGAKELKQNMKLGKLCLNDYCIIKVVDLGRVIGGGGICMKFTDLSKQIYEECPFSNNAPSYRQVSKGINICGECKTEKCEAYNEEVIVPLFNIRKFNLIEERVNLKCPICKGLIEPKTVAFFLCEYKVKGRNVEGNSIKPYEFFGKANNKNAAQYYNPIQNGDILVLELIIEIINYF